jgi:tetratricopeptide (TPR) repeat protein
MNSAPPIQEPPKDLPAGLLVIDWAVQGDGADVASGVLAQALGDLKHTVVNAVRPWVTVDAASAQHWAQEQLLRSGADVVVWAQPEPEEKAWVFSVAARSNQGASVTTAISRISWPQDQTRTDLKALQAVLQILVLLPSVQPGCSPKLADLLLDTLLHAEAWLLEPTRADGNDEAVTLAAMVGTAWLNLYRAAKNEAYIQRALETLQTGLAHVNAQTATWVVVAVRRALAETQMTHGLRLQDRDALEAAIAQFGEAAELQATLDKDESWAMVLVLQGHALESLAQMQRDESLWSLAANAYRSALGVLTRADHGTRWAAVKTNLGRVLSAWGRQQRSTDVLYEAVQVLDEALLVYSREDHPGAWASGQHYSGVVLQALGQIQRDSVQLVLALQAFENALKQRPRDTQPMAWATTKHHLASLLTQLGLEQDDPAKLKQAISGFQEALQVRTLSSSVQDWVATQHAMGRAYDALGRRDKGVYAFEQAIESYILALSQRTRNLAPLDWAVLQFDLGNVWLQVGYRLQQVPALQAAVNAYREALQVFDAARQSAQWTQASHNLAAALRRVGELGGHLPALEQAAQTYQQILEIKAPTLSGHDLATVVENLTACLTKVASQTKQRAPLEQAARAQEQALPVLDGKSADFAQGVRQQLARTWLTIGRDFQDEQALNACIDVLHTWTANSGEAPGTALWAQTQRLIAAAQTALALIEPTPERLVPARAACVAALEHFTRQSHAVDWAELTGEAALCEWLQTLAEGQSDAPQAVAVLSQVMAVLWRADPAAAARMERNHAAVQARAFGVTAV